MIKNLEEKKKELKEKEKQKAALLNEKLLKKIEEAKALIPEPESLEIDGIKMPINSWAEKSGIDVRIIRDRIESGWTGRDLISPVRDRASNDEKKYTHHLITYKGETKTLQEWSESTNIKLNTLISRMIKGWSVHDLFSPVQNRGRGAKHK